MASTFTLVTESSFTSDALFDVSLDIDAHVASLSGSGEQAIAGVTSGQIGLGESVTWRARHLGVWFSMTTRITAWDRPHRFVDEQVEGPFALYAHEHRFEPTSEGSRMTDTITVGSPVLGVVVERLVLVPYLRRLIRTRNRWLVEALGDAGANR